MALGITTQDKRGIVSAQSGGNYDSTDPSGSGGGSLGGNSSYTITHHVATTGSDSTGDGSEGNPWRTPEYAAKQLSAGDVLGIHAGTYVLSENNLPSGETMDRTRALVSPANGVVGTSGNEVVITNAGDGTVFLDAGATPSWAAVGSYWGSDYLIIDGLLVRGCIIMWGVDNMTVQNCEVYGGLDTPKSNGGDDFGNVMRIEWATNSLVSNNIFRDNADFGEGQANSPLVMEYDSTGVIIENNEIYNSVGFGIRLKDSPVDITVRNNFIHDNQFSGIQTANQDAGSNVEIHNNILLNNNTDDNTSYGGVSGLVLVDGVHIYNNTFVDNGYADIRVLDPSITNVNVYNNIFYNNSGTFYRFGWASSGATFSSSLAYSDYNCFYPSGNFIDQGTTYADLAAYNSATGNDANSVTTDPSFSDASGTTAVDFKRSSYPANGRGGSYESVMGAYIDGTETIGPA